MHNVSGCWVHSLSLHGLLSPVIYNWVAASTGRTMSPEHVPSCQAHTGMKPGMIVATQETPLGDTKTRQTHKKDNCHFL